MWDCDTDALGSVFIGDVYKQTFRTIGAFLAVAIELAVDSVEVTAQRSIEDAEEIERERRRRAREAFRSSASLSSSGGSPQDSGSVAEDGLYEGELKPSCQQALEEDEGFSDWTQKLERRKQRRLEEQGQAEEEEEERRTGRRNRPPAASEQEEEEDEWERKESERRRRREHEEAAWRGREEVVKRDERMKVIKRAEEEEDPIRDRNEAAKEKRKEVKVSYTSKVFLSQEVKHINGNGEAAGEELLCLVFELTLSVCTAMAERRRSSSSSAFIRVRSLSQALDGEEEAEVFLETEQKLEKIRRSHQEKETQELELLRQKQVEAEEERRHMKEEIERRRMEAAERRMKHLSTSSAEGEEPFSPLSPKSPSFKGEGDDRGTAESSYSITERTESLNRSLKKSNSIKKTQPPLLTTRIDDKLEHPPEPVAAKKNLFEAGEAWNQNSDAEGLKVGVADLITQWVKGSSDGSNRNSPAKPAYSYSCCLHVCCSPYPSLLRDGSSERSGPGVKGTPSGKRYKFVVTGHGKYEKILVNDAEYDEYMNGKSRVWKEGRGYRVTASPAALCGDLAFTLCVRFPITLNHCPVCLPRPAEHQNKPGLLA
ncbi:hypothetical protein JZ751_008129 [Albula glossodonta]|uniref:Non-muscle caldesmon n=1 Tax=Albula glossodonta TaxID=121402 RepID=A0A8T2N4Q0_9TELE|nr:hypothetical protein JZ751_008129 [Albula glossodonta]